MAMWDDEQIQYESAREKEFRTLRFSAQMNKYHSSGQGIEGEKMNIQSDKLIYGLESLTKKAPNLDRKEKEAGVEQGFQSTL